MSQIKEWLRDAPEYDPNAAKSGATAPGSGQKSQIKEWLRDAPPQDRGFTDWARDAAAWGVKGAIAVPEAAVGLADLASGGRAGKALESVGVRFKDARELANEWHSEATKEAQRKFHEAEGFGGKLKAALQNPSNIVGAVIESAPSMLAGGVAARGFQAATRLGQMGAKGAVAAGALGEGVVGAGSAAEQIRQETEDGYLGFGQAGAALATGAATAGFGLMGGKLAQRLGVGDVDTLLAQGQKGVARGVADEAAEGATRAAANPLLAQKAAKGIPRQVVEGAISEGLLEELPQSVAEQVLQNLALDKPWSEGVDAAAVMGVLSGGVMGAGAAGYRGFRAPAGGDVAGDVGAPAPVADASGVADEGIAPPVQPEAPPRFEALRQAWQAHMEALQEQESGEPDVPQSAPPDGAAALSRQRAAIEAQREADRQSASPDDEILQSTGAASDGGLPSLASGPVRPSEAMGLRAEDGPLSAAAVQAVDSGVSAGLQQAASAAAGVAAKPGGSGAAPQLAAMTDAELSATFRSAQAPDVRAQLAQELGRRRQARQEDAKPNPDAASDAAAKLREVEARIIAAARQDAAVDVGTGGIEAAMQSRRVPVPLKAQRNRLLEQVRQSGALEQVQALPAPPAQEGDQPVLQNRHRGTAASIAQMNAIAANPDYLRTGPSRTMDQGAPVVFGDLPEGALLGRAETVADGRGQRVATRYAVVDAADVLTSHTANGLPVQGYESGMPGKLRAVAGNGRAAGLTDGYVRGTAEGYRQELLADAASLGIDPSRVQGMQAPMLVRVMDARDVTADIGDRSNTVATARLSPVEEAANDARRVDLQALAFDENGNVTPEAMRGFIQAMPETERGNMLNPDGTPTRQAVDRLMAAAFKSAYENDALVQLHAQATDAEARTIMAALADAASAMAQLKGAGEFDIRQAVANAAQIAVNARRQGLKLADVIQNQDLDMNPEAFVVARFMADNIRSARRMADGLRQWAQLALEQVRIARQNETQAGMFGPQPTLSRAQLLERLGDEQRTQAHPGHVRAEQASAAQRGGAESVGQGAARADAQRAGDAGGAADGGEVGAGQDLSHLHALESRLFNESQRLNSAKTEQERKARQHIVHGIEREIDSERRFLGLPERQDGEQQDALTDDDLLNQLGLGDSQELSSYSQEDLRQREQQRQQAEANEQRRRADIERRAQADAERDEFVLTGSDRAADEATARGQQPMFSLAGDVEAETEAERQFKETERAYGGKDAWEKAKAAGKTKLTYGQWVQVRTPNFKKWFGDWEASRGRRALRQDVRAISLSGQEVSQRTGDSIDMKAMRAEAAAYAQDHVLGKHTNIYSGVTVEVRSVKEALQHHSGPDKLRALAAIPDVLRFGAVVFDGVNPKRPRERLVVIAGRVRIAGQDFLVSAGAREDANGRLFYDHEMLGVEKAEARLSSKSGAAASPGSAPSSASARLNDYTLAFMAQVDADVSQVTDPDTGEPLVVYHGTDKQFNTFTTQPGLRGNMLTGEIRTVQARAKYFTPDEEYAASYGSSKNSVENYLMPVFLHSKWLARLDGFTDIEEYTTDTEDEFENQEKQFWQYLEDDEFLNKFLEDYDGAVFEAYGGTEYVVFDPTQIKSATDNNGDFDAGNPDIRYSISAKTRAAYEARIDALFAGEKASRQGAVLLDRSDVMGLLGHANVPMVLNERHLLDGLTNHPEMTAQAWKRVPEWLENPAAVYTDPKHPGRLTVIAPERLSGYPVVMAVELAPDSRHDTRGAHQLLVTAFAKTTGDLPALGFLASSGRLLYTDTKTAPVAWPRTRDVPRTGGKAHGAKRILTEKNLAGWRKANAVPAAAQGALDPALARKTVALQQAVDAIHAQWENAPPTVVVADMNDGRVPDVARKNYQVMKSRGASGVPRGFYYDGKVYLVASQVKDGAAAARVMAHEVLGHHGLQGLFGKRLDSVLNRIGLARRATVVAKARSYGLHQAMTKAQAGKASDAELWRAMTAHERRVAAEEVLAEMAQAQPRLGFVREAIAAIRAWLRAHMPGFNNLRVTDDEIIREYILPARGWVIRGERAQRQGSGYVHFQLAWHGTPYRGIEKTGFQLNKIGTGEGAQAYGWGIYFASQRGVAEHYRKGLSYREQVRQFMRELPEDADIDEVMEALDRGELPQSTADVVRALADEDWLGFDYPAQAITAAFKELDNFDPSPQLREAMRRYSGQLYQVEVPEDSDLLDWDAPFNKQPKAAQDLWRSLAEGEFKPKRLSPNGKPIKWAEPSRGLDLYRQIGSWSKGKYGLDERQTEQAASLALRDAGIPGLRYLDGNSRADGEGSHNYVIWDEALLTPEAAQIEPMFSLGRPEMSDEDKARILQGEPVASVRMEDAPSGGYGDVVRWAADVFKQKGGKAINPDIGEVLLNEQAARDSMAHGGANAAKKAAFGAVKDVIERGALVYQATHGRKDSFYISAPVIISGRVNIVTALVHRDMNTQRMYLHSVMLKENLLKPSVSAADAEASEPHSATTSGDAQSIAPSAQNGKVDSAEVAAELRRLLTLDVQGDAGGDGSPMFSLNAGERRIEPVALKLQGWQGTQQQLGALARAWYGSHLQGKSFHNDDMNVDVLLSSEGKGTAFATSGNLRVGWRAEMVRVLPDLIRRAVRVGESQPDARRAHDSRAFHALVAALRIGDEDYAVKLTVREALQGPQPRHKFYDVTGVQIKRSPGVYGFDADASASRPTPAGASSALTVAELAEAVNVAPQSSGAGPMFSLSQPGAESAGLRALKSSAIDQVNAALQHAGTVSWWHKTVGTMRNLAERAPAFKPVFEAAQRFIDDVAMLASDASDRAPRLLPKLETWRDLGKRPVSAQDSKAVAQPLFQGTLSYGRDVDGRAVLTDELQRKYAGLSADDKAQMMLKAGRLKPEVLKMWRGQSVDAYEKAVASRFEGTILKPGVVFSDAELKDIFQATPRQISLYREARSVIDRSIDMTARADMLRAAGKDYAAMRDVVLEAPTLTDAANVLIEGMEQQARAEPDSREALADAMAAIRQRLDAAESLQREGYAPLTRFGKYTLDVVGKDGQRLFFGMYESRRESNLARIQMASAFPGATVTQGTMSDQVFKLFAGVTPESVELFGNMLGLGQGNEAQDRAFQAYLQLTKNNHSAMKRLIHRKGIAGYSEDVGRVLASFVYANARQAAAGLSAGKLEQAIRDIPQEQGELRDVAMGLRDYVQEPQEEGQAIRGMLFAQYLGGSVASAFVNMTQPFAVTTPWLSQYGGMGQASREMARALADMGRRGFKYEADLVRAMRRAEEDGIVSPQEIHQLMAQARGAGSLRSGDGTRLGDARAAAANAWERTKVAWGQPFALAEQFNRRSTFIAAYRIAKRQKMADPDAFARRAVLETQFLYSRANKPRWARGAVGGALFTFKTYSVSYLELMQRMWSQGGPEGKRAVVWALAMLMLMGGAGGLPFMEDLEDLIDGIAQIMGHNTSVKQWRKQFLADVVGKELAGFIEQGVSGLPGAPVDVSGRLGMGNVVPGTGLFLAKPNRERDVLELVGPAGDLAARGFAGARKALSGDVAGAAMEIAPTAVRNLAKGADMAATGMYRDNKGYKVLDTTMLEAAAKAMGFQPRSVAEVQEGNAFMQRGKSYYQQVAAEIRAQWARALFEKDEEALARAKERLEAWNRNNPDQPMTIRMPDVWKRVREMGKDRAQRIADTAPKALRRQMREMAAEAG